MSIFHHCGKTHVGNVRKLNEDSLISVPELGVFVVADGMGGHSGGDYASQSVVGHVDRMDRGMPSGEAMRAVRTAFLESHYAIQAEAERRGGGTIGSTAIALILSEPHFACLWVGDSRLYLLRDGQLIQLSRDHSLVNDLFDSGQITADEVDTHPHGNVITRAVGVGETLEIDKIRGTYEPGDRFLICSDGLSGYASFEDIRHCMMSAPITSVCDELIALALAGGGRDNITAITVEIPDYF